jgi:hypothetical protein
VAQGIEGHLRLSFIHITPYAHVLNALRAFRAASPAVQFSLREASTQQQVEWLEAGRSISPCCARRGAARRACASSACPAKTS